MGIMSKKIDRAAATLTKAVAKHASVASDKKAKKNDVQKASAKLRAAAIEYGALVAARSRAASPFAEIPDPRLDEPTVASLKAERDSLAKRRAGREKAAAQGDQLAG